MFAYVLVAAVTAFGSFVMVRLLVDDDTPTSHPPAPAI
jgi:hypothetical protein